MTKRRLRPLHWGRPKQIKDSRWAGNLKSQDPSSDEQNRKRVIEFDEIWSLK
jgi:hypothetical protein